MDCLRCHEAIVDGDMAYRYTTDDEDDDGVDVSQTYAVCEWCSLVILNSWTMDKLAE